MEKSSIFENYYYQEILESILVSIGEAFCFLDSFIQDYTTFFWILAYHIIMLFFGISLTT